MMPFVSLKKTFAIALMFLEVFCLGVFALSAQATDLPPGILTYLREKDPGVKVRFDGLIRFSNGQQYLPVFPQKTMAQAPEEALSAGKNLPKVLLKLPAGVPFPDLIQFDNEVFLLRMVSTSSQRYTLPRLAAYPIQLKSGILPQDLVLPSNLFIPAELKVILGAIPYTPSAKNQEAPAQKANDPFAFYQKDSLGATLYLADLTTQSIVGLDPATGSQKVKIQANCVPSGMMVSADQSKLYVPCLSTNELLVVDIQSGLIQNRVSVGSKPGAILYIPGKNKLIVSNRYSNFISSIDATELSFSTPITIPGSGGVMAYAAKTNMLFVADNAKGEVYPLADTTALQKTIKTEPSVTGLWVSPDGEILWVLSRNSAKLQVFSTRDGSELKTYEVSKKPVALQAYGDQLYVISSAEDKIDVFDWKTYDQLPSVSFEAGAFAIGLSVSPSEKTAYIAGAGTETVYVFNLEEKAFLSALPTKIRAASIAYAAGLIQNLPILDERNAAENTSNSEPASIGPTVEELSPSPASEETSGDTPALAPLEAQ